MPVDRLRTNRKNGYPRYTHLWRTRGHEMVITLSEYNTKTARIAPRRRAPSTGEISRTKMLKTVAQKGTMDFTISSVSLCFRAYRILVLPLANHLRANSKVVWSRL